MSPVTVTGPLYTTIYVYINIQKTVMPDYTTFTETIGHCHDVLDEIFLIHQEAVLLGRFDDAIQLFNCYRELHDLHKAFEDEKLIPKFNEHGNHGRWPASLYLQEHDKIRELMQKTENYLTTLSNSELDGRNLRRNIIAFLDREKTFKGYCEHHQDREEEGMLPELDDLADSGWRAGIIGPFVEEWENCVTHNTRTVKKILMTWETTVQNT